MIKKKVLDTIKRYGLLKKNDRIVVGVSGGPDSVALLYLLGSLSKELQITLHIAHLDHMLRHDSHKDREFVEKVAKELHIPVTTGQVNIKALARKGSVEEIARNARLGFLFRVARKCKTKKIALGHNLDDQAETVLMRILRGTGLYGLSGILPKRTIAGYQIIRPLIETRRKEIETYLKRRGISPRLDSTNQTNIYFRNRIRKELLPLLEKKYNKNIKILLANMAENIGYDYDYLNSSAAQLTNSAKNKLGLKKLLSIHPSLQRLAIRQCIAKVQGDTRRITFTHTREIQDLLLNRPVNSIVDLPAGLRVTKRLKYLNFYLKNKQ